MGPVFPNWPGPSTTSAGPCKTVSIYKNKCIHIPTACTCRPRPTGDHERVGICLIIRTWLVFLWA